jgi:putative transposase
LAFITGSVDEQLILQNEYLTTENLILRHQLQRRLQLTDSERISLAKIGKRLGRKALQEVEVKPAGSDLHFLLLT